MQSLEEKVDFMLQSQDDIRRSISNIQNNTISMMTIQRDMLQTQFEMQRDIKRLDKKIDDNYQKLDEKIDQNAVDTSEIFKDICVKLDELSNPKPKLTILR